MNRDTIEQTLGLGAAKPSPFKKYSLIALIIVIAAIALSFWFKHSSSQKHTYLTAPTKVQELTTTVSATGNLEPTNTIDVGIEVSGTITDVLVDYNDHVKAGDLMAKLDTTKLNSQVISSKASLMRMQANISGTKASLSNAQNEYERLHKMYTATRGNYPSKQSLDEADNALRLAKANVEAAIAQAAQANAELEAHEDNLKKAIVVAPSDGIILERKIEPGQTVVASMQTPVLFKMAKNLSTMKVIVSVDEADIGEVRENQRVSFSVDAYPKRIFEGHITQLRLNSQMLNGVVTYNAVVEVLNNDLLLRPGMTATAQIITGILPSTLTVPNAALRFTPPKENKAEAAKEEKPKTGKSVWILRQQKPVEIEVSASKSDGKSTAITSKILKEGDQVIIGVEENTQ